MNIYETVGVAYTILGVSGFTAFLLYMAFIGVRQYVADARENAAYRTAINEYQHLERMHGDGR